MTLIKKAATLYYCHYYRQLSRSLISFKRKLRNLESREYIAATRSNRRTAFADPATESGNLAVWSSRAYVSDQSLWGIKQL